MWIHVGRVIGLVWQKYEILSGILPIETLYSDNSTPQINKIVRVCCALTNICDSVVQFTNFPIPLVVHIISYEVPVAYYIHKLCCEVNCRIKLA